MINNTLEASDLESKLQRMGYTFVHLKSCVSTMKAIHKYETLSETKNTVDCNFTTNKRNFKNSKFPSSKCPNNSLKPIDYIILTDEQTCGLGRSGTSWFSEKNKDLIFTIHKTTDLSDRLLSIRLGIGVLNVLKNLYKLPVKFKWPNDLYLDGKKLSGILIKNEFLLDGRIRSRIGFGLNVNSAPKDFISIKQFTGKEIAIPQLFYEIFCAMHNVLTHHKSGKETMVFESVATGTVGSANKTPDLMLDPQDDYLHGHKISFINNFVGNIEEYRNAADKSSEMLMNKPHCHIRNNNALKSEVIVGNYAGYSADGIVIKKSRYEVTTYNNATKIEICD